MGKVIFFDHRSCSYWDGVITKHSQNEDDTETKNILSWLPGSWLEAGVNSWFCGWGFSATAQYSCNAISLLSELLFPLLAYAMGKWTWRNPSPIPPISETIKDIVANPVLQLDFSHVLGFSPTPTRKQNQTFTTHLWPKVCWWEICQTPTVLETELDDSEEEWSWI